MRGFFTSILFFLFFIVFPLAIFSYAASSVLTPGYVKGKLSESKIYATTANSMSELINLPEDVTAEMTAQTKADFEEFLKEQVTADYLQKKTESFVDSGFAWLSGTTETAPSTDLTDLDQKLDAFAKEKGSPMPKDFIEPTPIKIEPTKGNLQIRQTIQIIQKAPIFLAVASGVILLLIFLLAQSWKSKLRKLFLAFFVAIALSILPTATLIFLYQAAVGLVIDSLQKSEIMEPLSESVKSLLSGVTTDLIKVLLTIFGLSLVAAAIFFLTSFFVGNKPKEPAKVAINHAGNETTGN